MPCSEGHHWRQLHYQGAIVSESGPELHLAQFHLCPRPLWTIWECLIKNNVLYRRCVLFFLRVYRQEELCIRDGHSPLNEWKSLALLSPS